VLAAVSAGRDRARRAPAERQGEDAAASGGPAPAPPSLAVTWAGHATTLIELDGARLLTDPLLRGRVGPLLRTAPPVPPGVTEGLDAVVISHLHADHAHAASLRRLAPARVVAPAGSGRWLARQGLRDVIELSAGERAEVAGVTVTAVPAIHDHRRWRFGSGAEPIGIVVEGSQSCYFAGDTDLFEGMRELAGAIDLALLPVWGWGPSVGPGHLDPAAAATAAGMISPRVAVPIHWGTLALPWRALRGGDASLPARRFSELVARDAANVEVRVIAPGERTELGRAADGEGERT
jgi:L-ascorbate metabolism protein UlaG (beta-lactamase superfamily)